MVNRSKRKRKKLASEMRNELRTSFKWHFAFFPSLSFPYFSWVFLLFDSTFNNRYPSTMILKLNSDRTPSWFPQRNEKSEKNNDPYSFFKKASISFPSISIRNHLRMTTKLQENRETSFKWNPYNRRLIFNHLIKEIKERYKKFARYEFLL